MLPLALAINNVDDEHFKKHTSHDMYECPCVAPEPTTSCAEAACVRILFLLAIFSAESRSRIRTYTTGSPNA